MTGCVHPHCERQGIGTYLVRWGKERALQAVAWVPAEARVSLYCNASSTHTPSLRLLEKLGWSAIRCSWLMMIDLDQPPPEPRWLAGIVVRTYQERPDLRTVWRATNESLSDHWGHVDMAEEAGPRWEHRMRSDPHSGPTVWFLAMDGEEIAGVSLSATEFAADQDTGFVNQLGVRRPWRRLGLGLALLRHTFGEFYRRGKKRIGLGVDAGSLTGATWLYEKAGMRAVQQIGLYEKELYAGRELRREALPEWRRRLRLAARSHGCAGPLWPPPQSLQARARGAFRGRSGTRCRCTAISCSAKTSRSPRGSLRPAALGPATRSRSSCV